MKQKKLKIYILAILVVLVFLVAVPLVAQAETDIVKNLTGVASAAKLTKVDSLQTLIGRIIQTALGFLGIGFLGLILFGGYEWMTAQGDSGKVNKAKDLIKNAIIGVIIILCAYSITYFVINELQTNVSGSGGDNAGGLTPAEQATL
ncbi:MAG: pilin [bacterium]